MTFARGALSRQGPHWQRVSTYSYRLALALSTASCAPVEQPRPSAGAPVAAPPSAAPVDAAAPILATDEPKPPEPLGLPKPDGPLYELPFAARSARIRGGALELVLAPECELMIVDPLSGQARSRAALPGIRMGPAVDCRCDLGADVVVCKDGKREAQALGIPKAENLWTRSPSDPDFDWSFTELGPDALVLEWPWARMRKLPPQLLAALESRTGKLKWSEEILGSTALPGRGFASDGARLALWSGEDPSHEAELTLYASGGRRVWRRSFPWSELGILIDSHLVVQGRHVAFQRGHGVTLLDARSGEVLLKLPQPAGARVTSLAVCGDSLLVTRLDLGASSSALSVVSTSDGKERFVQTHRMRESSSAVCTEDRVFWQEDGRLSALDARSGQELWSYFSGRPGSLGGLRLVHPELLLFSADLRTTAFATGSQLSARSASVSGRIKLASRLAGVSQNLGGIEVRAGEAQATTDASGRFRLELQGRGRAELRVAAAEWLARQKRLKTPAYTFPCVRDVETPSVDLESATRAHDVELTLKVEPCIVDP